MKDQVALAQPFFIIRSTLCHHTFIKVGVRFPNDPGKHRKSEKPQHNHLTSDCVEAHMISIENVNINSPGPDPLEGVTLLYVSVASLYMQCTSGIPYTEHHPSWNKPLGNS
jgi:hypothetical protein